MPRFDGTGPFGDGRMGRGLGPCGRGARPFGARRAGAGTGYGYGRRWRCYDGAYPNYYQGEQTDIYPYDKASLQAQKKELEERMAWIDEQLKQNEDK